MVDFDDNDPIPGPFEGEHNLRFVDYMWTDKSDPDGVWLKLNFSSMDGANLAGASMNFYSKAVRDNDSGKDYKTAHAINKKLYGEFLAAIGLNPMDFKISEDEIRKTLDTSKGNVTLRGLVSKGYGGYNEVKNFKQAT